MIKEIYEGDSFNRLYIMRGLPGSGKSTLAQKRGGLILGADDFFMFEGAYKFNFAKIREAHEWNIERAKKALENGVSRITIDNINVSAWEIRPYAELGFNNKYAILLVEPETPHKWDVKILAEKNIHNVPEKVIQEMKDLYEHDLTLEKILKAERPN
jgi:predicted kinase